MPSTHAGIQDMRKIGRWVSFPLALLGLACTENMPDRTPGRPVPSASTAIESGSGGSVNGTTSAASGGQSTLGPAATGCQGSVDPGFVAIRALTRVEYNYTVQDLLGDTTQPASQFPNEDSVLAEQSHVSSLLFEKHQAAAKSMIDSAWAREGALGATGTSPLSVCPLGAGGVTCARSILLAFANRAWRRPVSEADLAGYWAVFEGSQQRGEAIADSLKLALQGILLSPEFIYRIEPDAAQAAARPLTAHELSVRLSYLFTGSLPDAALRALADTGALLDQNTLSAEMDRLLQGPAGERFSRGVTRYWLYLGALESAQPNPTSYPEFNESLRQAMTEETVRVFHTFVNQGKNALDLLDADFTFMNDGLATLYGVTLPASQLPPGQLRLVPLAAGPRRGLLGHASILSMTSPPSSTAPVKRGKWVLSSLLCSSPPPPPPDLSTLQPDTSGATNEREKLALHRASPACAGCHNLMDPIGLGLENFDGIGRYRASYPDGSAISVGGTLADGSAFASVEELRTLLKADARVSSCMADRLFSYAVGRTPSASDSCVQTELVKQFKDQGGQLKNLISGLIASPAFRYRRGENGSVL